ncbi:MAG TPA: helix-turn-helix domain-containing protein [Terriglobia bacterium]|jgi:hypothetical protein|nr:helix-turn-helix domain-containing protein [Terriglobia bacterium]
MNKESAFVSRDPGDNSFEMIDSDELAARLGVPPSWVRNRTRSNTPTQDHIPCVRLGRYVRFEWLSPQLEEWLAGRRH